MQEKLKIHRLQINQEVIKIEYFRLNKLTNQVNTVTI